jgi:capsular polysaccharide biosynthesis protein
MFKKKIQILFKFIIQKIFFFIYGKIKFDNDPNLNLFDTRKISTIKSDVYPDKIYQIYYIKNASIYTDTNENVAIIKNNFIVPGISFQQSMGFLKDESFNSVLSKGTPRFKKKINGRVFNLAQGASGNNYFHFMFDIIPKLKLLKEVEKIIDIDYFYVPKIQKWQLKIYELLSLNKNKLIDSEQYRHINATEIITVDHPWYFKNNFQNEVINIPDWIIKDNRKSFFNFALKFNNNNKIFLDRSSSKYSHCQITNNDEFKKILEIKGFTSYKVEELTFQEQIYLFQEASIIIGAHGAAFTNIIYCKPKTKIIEIIPTSHPNKKCERISNILNLNHHKIITKDTSKDKFFPYNITLEQKHFNKISDIIDLY